VIIKSNPIFNPSYLLRDEFESEEFPLLDDELLLLDSERLLRLVVVDELLFESSELLRFVVVELLFESELLRLVVVEVELLRELDSVFSTGRALEFLLRFVPVCVLRLLEVELSTDVL
jgi:hypothetical protein